MTNFSFIRPFVQPLVLILIWLFANAAAWNTIDYLDRRSLEKKYGLRSGILEEFESRKLSVDADAPSNGTFRYRVFEPAGSFAPSTLPVIMVLHGSGERGWDNLAQLKSLPSHLSDSPYRETHPCLIVVPQCPSHTDWNGYRRMFSKQTADASPSDHPRDPLLRILDEVLMDQRADPERITIIGYSMGSFGAWQLAADHGEFFSAVVPIAGGGPSELAERLTNVPIWAVHGLRDNVCQPKDTIELVEAIRKHDASAPVRMSTLPDIGHGAWKPMFSGSTELMDWIFRQKRRFPRDDCQFKTSGR